MALNLSGTTGIVTGNIAASNITTATIADDNVTTAKILNANVTQAKLSQPLTLATAQNATGTSVDFTGIPSWVKRITVLFVGVSTNGTSPTLLQIGDSGGIETTGYLGATSQNGATVYSHANNNGIVTDAGTNAAAIRHGMIVLSLVTASTNTWANSGTIGRSDDNLCSYIGGTKPLSGTLTQLRVTTFNGTDTFDAGSVNIMYEG